MVSGQPIYGFPVFCGIIEKRVFIEILSQIGNIAGKYQNIGLRYHRILVQTGYSIQIRGANRSSIVFSSAFGPFKSIFNSK